MPYKDPEKQKEAVRRNTLRWYRRKQARLKGLREGGVDPEVLSAIEYSSEIKLMIPLVKINDELEISHVPISTAHAYSLCPKLKGENVKLVTTRNKDNKIIDTCFIGPKELLGETKWLESSS